MEEPSKIDKTAMVELPCLLTIHDHNKTLARTMSAGQAQLKQVIAVSSSVKESLVSENSLNEDMITVIHSGVTVPDLIDNSEVLGARRIPVIGTAGRLEESKGFPYFIKAARQVLDAGNDVEFLPNCVIESATIGDGSRIGPFARVRP